MALAARFNGGARRHDDWLRDRQRDFVDLCHAIGKPSRICPAWIHPEDR